VFPSFVPDALRALDADERNFHAWNYRQFIVRLMKRPLSEELLYSEEKVCVGGVKLN